MTKQITVPVEQKDIIVSFISGIINFCKKNKKGVIAACIIIVLASIIGGCYSAHIKKINQRSWAAYYAAQVALAEGKEEEGFFLIDGLTERYPGTDAAQYAQLMKGDVLYNAGKYTQAADTYKLIITSKNPILSTVAALSLAASQQAMQDYASAAAEMNQFIQNYPTSFALPQAYFTLALSQELAGNKTEALNAYKHLADAYAMTYFGRVAKDKMNQLQK